MKLLGLSLSHVGGAGLEIGVKAVLMAGGSERGPKLQEAFKHDGQERQDNENYEDRGRHRWKVQVQDADGARALVELDVLGLVGILARGATHGVRGSGGVSS